MKIAINGFGRIGRIVTRQLFNQSKYKNDLELVAINDVSSPKDLAYVLKYDSVHGRSPLSIEAGENFLSIEGQKIPVTAERNPENLPWKKLDVDMVFECTGRFKDKDGVAKHFQAGAKKVMLSAPGSAAELTIVMGINQELYNPSEHNVVSNASCTTNCLAPLAWVLNNSFGIKKGLMTTVHSYTGDQRLLDNTHSDPRRGRSAAMNIVPTTTGAAKSVGQVIPELKGKLDGLAVRVPTANVSFTDLCVELEKSTNAQEITQALKEASGAQLKGILEVCEEPLVSSDFMGSPLSSIVDASLTTAIGDNFFKICSWYDNETGFSCRMLDLAQWMNQKS